MAYNWIYILKALHAVGFVAWFAGLFYLVRMFVYHVEAFDKEQPERDILSKQLNLMEWRVYKIICNPAMMITWTAGLVMLGIGIFNEGVPNYLASGVGTPGWMHLKLLLLVLLLGYHLWSKRIIKRLEKGERVFTAWRFRLFNEVPTILLVAIVFVATLGNRGLLNYIYLTGGLVVFIGLIWYGAYSYKKRRESGKAM